MPALVNGSTGADSCPVCRSTRYLNPNLKFYINPECYHRMCGSCVERIFSSGPAPCPVAGCGKTLRRARFRIPTFTDIQIERECDIRKHVGAVMNLREEDFEELMSYNNYLEDVEEINQNLIHRVDVPLTEKKLKKFEEEHRALIAKNRGLSDAEVQAIAAEEDARKTRVEQAKADRMKELLEERSDREEARKETMEKIKSGDGDLEELVRQEERKLQLKKSSAKKRFEATPVESGSGMRVSGLRKMEVKESEKPYDPFDGLRLATERFTLKDHFEHDWLRRAMNDPGASAGGFDVLSYYTRAMFDAHAGLGCDIATEKAKQSEGVASTRQVAAT